MQSSTMIRRTRVEVDLAAIVGNAQTRRATRASRVAVLPPGYANGWPRMASGRAFAAIRGRRAPLSGVIGMDIAVADVTDLPEVAVGDAAVLPGRASGGGSISVAEYGAWSGLSEYEVTCGMSKRVPRTYVGDPP
jgi:alanine racemase